MRQPLDTTHTRSSAGDTRAWFWFVRPVRLSTPLVRQGHAVDGRGEEDLGEKGHR